jgi:hypothetical protein
MAFGKCTNVLNRNAVHKVIGGIFLETQPYCGLTEAQCSNSVIDLTLCRRSQPYGKKGSRVEVYQQVLAALKKGKRTGGSHDISNRS